MNIRDVIIFLILAILTVILLSVFSFGCGNGPVEPLIIQTPNPFTPPTLPPTLEPLTTQFAVFNLSFGDSLIESSDLTQATSAVQSQSTSDFAPVWGIQASFIDGSTLSADTNTDKLTIPANLIPVFIVNSGDYDSQAVAYHGNQIKGQHNLPLPIQDNGIPDIYLVNSGCPYIVIYSNNIVISNSLSTVLSHEVLETLIDPWANIQAIQVSHNGNPMHTFFYEVCDPTVFGEVGINSYTVTVNSTLVYVSNFVWPEWFNSNSQYREIKPKYDQVGYLTRPFQTIGDPGMTVDLERGLKQYTTNGNKSAKGYRHYSLKAVEWWHQHHSLD